MPGLFDCFNVYKSGAHSNTGAPNRGGSNTGGSRTQYMTAREYRKSSVSSESSMEDEGDSMPVPKGTMKDSDYIVDLRNISASDFERMYKGLKKGEPNNRVNF